MAAAIAERDALRTQVAELQRDAERLSALVSELADKTQWN